MRKQYVTVWETVAWKDKLTLLICPQKRVSDNVKWPEDRNRSKKQDIETWWMKSKRRLCWYGIALFCVSGESRWYGNFPVWPFRRVQWQSWGWSLKPYCCRNKFCLQHVPAEVRLWPNFFITDGEQGFRFRFLQIFAATGRETLILRVFQF